MTDYHPYVVPLAAAAPVRHEIDAGAGHAGACSCRASYRLLRFFSRRASRRPVVATGRGATGRVSDAPGPLVVEYVRAPRPACAGCRRTAPAVRLAAAASCDTRW